MALIKTLEEIQQVLPKLVSSLSDFSLQPNFDRTENKYIVPVIGTTLLEALQTAYDAETLDANETILVKHIRLVTSAYGYYDELGLYMLSITDTGARNIAQGGTERVYAWQLQELKNTLLKAAHEGLEILLNYLFEEKALYPEWTGSEQYTKINSLLIKSGTDLNDNYTIFQPQRNFFIMKSLMTDVQLLYIQEDIGQDLLEYLRDVADPSADEKICIAYLKKALTFYTVAKACKNFSVQFSDGGFTILGEKNTYGAESSGERPTDLQLLEMKIRECETDGASYLELAKNKMVALYAKVGATVDFKAAFAAGPLASYVQPDDRTSGNETRKTFAF